MTISQFIAALDPQLPDGVEMSYIKRPQYEGLSIFFVGPSGNSACQLYGVWDQLAANKTGKMTRRALRAANRAA